MHSTRDLHSSAFTIRVAGRQVPFDGIFPGFEERDRLGFVVRTPGGLAGASTAVMAAVTAYCDFQRSKPEHPFIYPDYFVIHAGEARGRHGMFDLWPDHKEVVVEGDAESVLRAINDRGITRLLGEEPSAHAQELAGFESQTRSSALARMTTGLFFAPSGRVKDGDVEIWGNDVTERYVEQVLDESRDLLVAPLRTHLDVRRSLITDGRPVETFQRAPISALLASISRIGR